MMRKISAVLAALAFAVTTLAPVAEARDGYRRGYDRDYYGGRHYRHDRHDNDDGDAVAAGAVGLILGLAIGSLASQPRQQSYNGCYDRCAPPPPPPPRCYDRCGGGYQDQRYYNDRRGSAYEDDYGLDGGYYEDQRPQCVRRERQWDRYANRYVVVDVPC